MSEETPNQSEERLQRHAKERRAQGGDFALHPATRQMLQGEVARTFARKNAAAKSRDWFSWLNSWSGRIAIGATAVVVVTGAWIFWNSRLDQRAMQLARAEMPVSESKLAGSEGTIGFVAAEKELAMASAPVPQPVTLLAAVTSPKADSDAGKIAADKMTVVDALAKNSSVAAYQEQLSAASQLANDTTLSFAPVAQKTYGANATDARNQQTFNYANAAAQNFAPPGQTAGNVADRSQNQAGQILGGSLAYANNEQKQLMESDVQSRAQGGSPLAAQNYGATAPESRARFSRSDAPGAPAPSAAPAAVSLARAGEPQVRGGGEALRGAVVANGAAVPDEASRNYRSIAGLNDETRSKALAPLGRSLPETSPVLNEFVIEQRGAAVRVLDGDGSVYDGTIETPPSAGFVPGKDSPDGLVREAIPGDKAETAPRHQELSFRATGSNVTLRQSVVVNGRFTPGTEAARAGRAMPAEATSKLRDFTARRAVPAMSNAFAGQYGAATNAASTIEGTVRIGTTNQQWFRANRRGP